MAKLLGLGMLLLGAPGALFGGERSLLAFDQALDLQRVTSSDARAELVTSGTNRVLRVRTGHVQQWPGITLRSPDGHWDLSSYSQLVATIHNAGSNAVVVFCRVDNPGADGVRNCVTESLHLRAGETGALRVSLHRAAGSTLDGKLFGMRGYPSANGAGPLVLSNITQLLLFVNHPTEDHSFQLADLRATGVPTAPTASVTDAATFFPFLDTFGQYRHRDWPGKVHSVEELQNRRKTEAEELAVHPSPDGWDEYGGWANGPKLDSTGFFRTEKVQGKWWLVDPAGHLFWSHGIDCVRMLDTTPIEERTSWFAEFPGNTADFQEFLSSGRALKGHYAGRNLKCFSFAGANLKRKYGAEWKTAYADTVHLRLRSWGLNTIANWSDAGVCRLRRTPYTDTVGSYGAKMIEGSEGYWGRFPDVFDTSFAAAVRQAMEGKRNSSANDPWCLGYFSDNEMSWGDDTSLALGVLKSPAAQAAKKVFWNELKTKYREVSNLNAVWKTSYETWEAFLASRQAPDRTSARADLTAFYTRTAEAYFRTVRDAIKAVAPHQLYIGCRFAAVNDAAAQAAGRYCDVVSYNLYQQSIADFSYPGPDRPLIVGEFHFGALDRGLFHTGLVPVEDQAARAQAYRNYVLGALHHPQFVGTHWFQWQDEPTTGRVYDEENYQIGFIDVADTPYAETIAASREIGSRLYSDR